MTEPIDRAEAERILAAHDWQLPGVMPRSGHLVLQSVGCAVRPAVTFSRGRDPRAGPRPAAVARGPATAMRGSAQIAGGSARC